jgi:hypothetical protein
MEAPMSNSTIKYEIKLPKYLIVLLVMMVIGLFANAFSPAFSIKEAFAEGHDSTRGISRALNGIATSILAIDCRS